MPRNLRHGLLAALLLAACNDVAPQRAIADASSDAAPALDAPVDVVVLADSGSADQTIARDDGSADVEAAAVRDVSIDAPGEVSSDVFSDVTPDATPDARDATSDLDEPALDIHDAALEVQDSALDVRDSATDSPSDITVDVIALDLPSDLAADVPPDLRADASAPDAPPGAWRSALFPDDWVPVHAGGHADSMGRFLHDFSFAGYHRGDERPPYGRGTIVRTVNARLGDGTTDATAAIQADLDAACASTVGGLRVVFIPAGTYLLRFPTSGATDSALRITCSNLVVRGTGPSATRLLLDDPTNARDRSMIRFAARSYNVWSGSAVTALSRDALTPSRNVTVPSTASFARGDFVAVRTDVTEAFRAEHRMNIVEMGVPVWPASTSLGLLYPRRVTAIDATTGAITLDAPTRYPLKMRDNARLYKPTGYITEVGLEDLAFGMREHATSAIGTLPGPLGDDADAAYDTPGTAAYDVHASTGVRTDAVHDGWIHNVETFLPAGNTSGAHVLSIALLLTPGTSRVTGESCRIGRAQYRGGGGNGYLFLPEGDDNLLVDDVGTEGRHNFITAHIASSGNVFVRVRSVASRLADDAHKFLSQANLYDSVALDGAWLQAVNRGYDSGGGGFTATQTVFWNTHVVAAHARTIRPTDGFPAGFAIETAQFGWGYAIGTSGAVSAVLTRALTNNYYAGLDQGDPVDFVEGVGIGATLFPSSLYDEQLRRRVIRGE